MNCLRSRPRRPRKGEGQVRSRFACEAPVIGQFLRRAREFPPNAEKKCYARYAINNLFKSLLRKLTFQHSDCKLHSFFQTVVFIFTF